MEQLDETGEWIGTCEKCGTNHGGYPPNTMGGQLACVEIQARRLGGAIGDAMVVDLGRIRNRLRDARDKALARFLSS